MIELPLEAVGVSIDGFAGIVTSSVKLNGTGSLSLSGVELRDHIGTKVGPCVALIVLKPAVEKVGLA